MVDVGAIMQAGASTLDTAAGIGTSVAKTWADRKAAIDARNWSARQAANRHQVEVEDLKKAGLNPILSASGGSGAPMPQVTVPEVTAPHINLGEKFLQYYKIWNDAQNVQADTNLKGYLVEKTKQETATELSKQSLNSALTSKELSQQALNLKLSDKTLAEIAKLGVDTSLSSALQKKALADAALTDVNRRLGEYEAGKQQKVKGLYDQPAGKVLKYVEALKGANPTGVATGLGVYFKDKILQYLKSGSGRTFKQTKKPAGASGSF